MFPKVPGTFGNMNYQSIKILPDHVTRKIAAGEVIDRPASIVKELLENSIDAHATKIEVFVTNGGMSSIIVQDNGIGIAQTDIALTIEKNATSKIISDEDLTRLDTFGFRGEALSSISAVSKFQLQTKRKEDHEGSVLKVDDKGRAVIEPTGTKDGTRIQISNLFFNTPARKKFLRSKTTEFGHIEKTFKKIALAHPEISFSLYKDEAVSFQLPSVATDLERIQQLYPTSMSDSLTPLNINRDGITIHGFVSNSQTSFSGAQEIWLFINRRWITDRALQRAVLEGYRTALMEHRYPMAFVYIDMPPDKFDVNVHPTKSEVRFERPQDLFNLLVQGISAGLRKEPARHYVSPLSTPAFSKSTTFGFAQSYSPYPIHKSPWAPAQETPQSYNAQGFFSQLECLGSLDHTYILCRSEDSLFIIDQHAAHERVLFDQFKKSFENKKPVQQNLLIPLTLQLSPAQFECVRTQQNLLKEIGFDLDEFGDNAWIFRSIPSGLKEKHAQQILLDFIDDALNENKSKTFSDHQDHVLSTMACHAAVRAHDVLNGDEIRHLLTRMDEVDLSSYCPHGRPTFLKLSKENLEVLFKRV
jgi:DNA mismatch repair protein MutL